METIPLPALSIRPPDQQQQDPLQNYGRLLQLKNMMQNQPLQNQQLQNEVTTSGAQAQMSQSQAQDMQTLRQVQKDPSINWDSPDAYSQLFSKAQAAGVSPLTLAPLQQHIAQQKQAAAATDKDVLQASSEFNDQARGMLTSVVKSAGDPQKYQANYEQTLKDLGQLALSHPGSSQAVKQLLSQAPSQAPNPDDLTQIANHLAAGSALTKEAIDNKVAQARLDTALKPTKDSLAAAAAKGDATAQKALDTLNQLDVTKAGQEEQARLNVSMSPAEIQLAAHKAASIASAEQPIKAATAGAEESARQNVALSPQATAGKAAQEAATTQAKTEVENKQKMTADEARRSDLANNMNENLDKLQDIVQRRPDLFGPLAGRITGLKQKIGTSDPDVAALETIKEQMGMAMVGAHAMRNAQHVETAANSIIANLHNEPNAMQSSIQQARDSLGTFTKDVQGGAIRSQTPAQSQFRVGQPVSIKGKQMTITAVHPDGTFDAK